MVTKSLISILLFLFTSHALPGQTEWILQLKDGNTPDDLMSNWKVTGLRMNQVHQEYIAPHFNIVKLTTQEGIDKKTVLNNPTVLFAERNEKLEIRSTTPNDPLIPQEWHLDNISAPKAWDQTTGGLTFNKDTLVLGFIDLGIMTSHEDLKNRIWVNRAEIPGNGKDDDGNGYTDDVNGLSLRYKNEKQSVDNSSDGLTNHGTSVAGLMCGEANNKVGIAGLMWNSKLMVTTFSASPTVADLIECFNYILDQRIRYNTSNGKQGALVVTINYSGGISFAKAADYPIWCGLYDKMGAAGILNCGATTNKYVDVDEEGDMPSTCPSEFLIAVTNTGKDNKRVYTAGFGSKSIDLGSPGEEVYTTNSAAINSYTIFSGCSAATPIVAGAVGLLYSYPCKEWADFLKQFPTGAARIVKKSLLAGVDKNADLTGKTVSGGRLNISRAMDTLKSYVCGKVITVTKDQVSIKSITPNPATDQISIQLDSNASGTYKLQLINSLGQIVFKKNDFTILNSTLLSLPYLSDGIYVLTLVNGNKQASKKLIIGR